MSLEIESIAIKMKDVVLSTNSPSYQWTWLKESMNLKMCWQKLPMLMGRENTNVKDTSGWFMAHLTGLPERAEKWTNEQLKYYC